MEKRKRNQLEEYGKLTSARLRETRNRLKREMRYLGRQIPTRDTDAALERLENKYRLVKEAADRRMYQTSVEGNAQWQALKELGDALEGELQRRYGRIHVFVRAGGSTATRAALPRSDLDYRIILQDPAFDKMALGRKDLRNHQQMQRFTFNFCQRFLTERGFEPHFEGLSEKDFEKMLRENPDIDVVETIGTAPKKDADKYIFTMRELDKELKQKARRGSGQKAEREHPVFGWADRLPNEVDIYHPPRSAPYGEFKKDTIRQIFEGNPELAEKYFDVTAPPDLVRLTGKPMQEIRTRLEKNKQILRIKTRIMEATLRGELPGKLKDMERLLISEAGGQKHYIYDKEIMDTFKHARKIALSRQAGSMLEWEAAHRRGQIRKPKEFGPYPHPPSQATLEEEALKKELERVTAELDRMRAGRQARPGAPLESFEQPKIESIKAGRRRARRRGRK